MKNGNKLYLTIVLRTHPKSLKWLLIGNLLLILFLSLQECGDPSAVLWLDEIQDAILRANKDSEDALQCKNLSVLLNLNINMILGKKDNSFLNHLSFSKAWSFFFFFFHLQSLRRSSPLMRLWITRTLLRHWQPCVHLLLVCMESRLNVLRPTRTTCFELKRTRKKEGEMGSCVDSLIFGTKIYSNIYRKTSTISFFYSSSQVNN